MNQPKTCAVCREPLEIVYWTPGWMRYDSGGGMYAGPLSVPQCKSCGADAYEDSRGWHIRKFDYRKATTVFTIKAPTYAEA